MRAFICFEVREFLLLELLLPTNCFRLLNMLKPRTFVFHIVIMLLNSGTVVNCCLEVCPFCVLSFQKFDANADTIWLYEKGCYIDWRWSYPSRVWLKEWIRGTTVFLTHLQCLFTHIVLLF